MQLDLSGLIAGIAQALSFQGLIAVFVGVAWGIVAGALPGITSSVGMAIFLPFTWGMEPGIALTLLAGIYVGAEYGGSIPAILIRAPGEPSNVPATMDGYAMHMRGETGKALGYSLVPGTIASLFGAVGMILLLVPLSYVSLLFGAPELMMLAIFGLSAVVGLSKKSLWKGLASVLFGLLLATVGPDYVSGEDRFTFGISDLLDGIKTVPVVIGLLAMSEMFTEALNIHAPAPEVKFSGKENFTLPTVAEYIRVLPATLLGSVIGLFVGVMPGAGATIASFLSYNEMRRWSKDREPLWPGGSRCDCRAGSRQQCRRRGRRRAAARFRDP